jgi:hypothetical protein
VSLTGSVTCFTTDARFSGCIARNAVAHKAFSFELRPDDATEDCFVRKGSKRRKPGRHHKAKAICGELISNLDKRRTLEFFVINFGDASEEAQTLPSTADHGFHASVSRETSWKLYLPPKSISDALEIVSDAAVDFQHVEILR